jgi:hypothetical protein
MNPEPSIVELTEQASLQTGQLVRLHANQLALEQEQHAHMCEELALIKADVRAWRVKVYLKE